MQTKNNKIYDVSAELDTLYGKEGTEERAKFDDDAWNFYTSQILLEARKEAKVTQSELAKRLSLSKSYISRVENGLINPSVGTFFRIIKALGMRVDVVHTIQ